MKKQLLFTLCLLPFVAIAQDGFTIKGKISNPNASMVILSYRTDSAVVIDTAKVIDGIFELKGTLKDPALADLKLKNTTNVKDTTQKTTSDILKIYIENTNIDILATDSLKYAKISGSKVNDDFVRLQNELAPLEKKMMILFNEYNSYTYEQKQNAELMKPLGDRYNKIEKEKEPVVLAFIQNNHDSFIGLLALTLWINYVDINSVEAEFLKMSPHLQSSTLGQNIAQAIKKEKISQVGSMFTDFTQNNTEGKAIKLSDFKGKYVLVDFWASWCGPCRAENPNVVQAYQKYKNKNFTIIGVSLDNPGQKKAWLKAIKDDKLTWTQVSDLKGWKNEVALMYKVQSIPFNFLINPEGKIIARNIRGNELHQTLKKFLK